MENCEHCNITNRLNASRENADTNTLSGRFWLENHVLVRFYLCPNRHSDDYTGGQMILEDLSKPAIETSNFSKCAKNNQDMDNDQSNRSGGTLYLENAELLEFIKQWDSIKTTFRSHGTKSERSITLPSGIVPTHRDIMEHSNSNAWDRWVEIKVKTSKLQLERKQQEIQHHGSLSEEKKKVLDGQLHISICGKQKIDGDNFHTCWCK